MTKPLIPPEALEGLFRKAFLDRTLQPGLFWEGLIKSDLFVPVAQGAEVPDPDTDGAEIPIVLGQDETGKRVAWVFTSPGAMVEYMEKEFPVMAMAAPRLLKRVLEFEVDIVLIGPDGVVLRLHPELVRGLSEGKAPETLEEEERTVPKEAQVYVGRPSEDTTALEARFKELFETVPEVKEAQLLQMSDDAGPRLVMGLRLNDDSKDALRRVGELIAKAAQGVLDKGKSMEVTLINRSLKGAFEKWGKTFFRRET